MPKTAMVRARVEPRLKHRAERVLTRLGLTPTEAITIFYRQVEMCNGLPFEVVIPNATTLRTLRDVEAGRDLIVSESADAMFKKLGI